MASGSEWQCSNCGDHPSSFVGDKPSSGGKCAASGFNHVWEYVEEGPTNSRNWQCRKCGTYPTSWVGSRPSSGGKCPATGYKHVWTRL